MRWFRNQSIKKEDPVAELTEAIERLQAGTLMNLTLEYSSRMPSADASALAMCVLCYCMAVAPIGDAAKAFQQSNANTVRAEAMKLSANDAVVTGLRYLYSGLTMLIAIRTRDPLSDASTQLGNRATELSFQIPNTYDICGSDDAVTCIAALSSYAKGYVRPGSDTMTS